MTSNIVSISQPFLEKDLGKRTMVLEPRVGHIQINRTTDRIDSNFEWLNSLFQVEALGDVDVEEWNSGAHHPGCQSYGGSEQWKENGGGEPPAGR